MSIDVPRTIPQLWHALDRRLTIIEEAQKAHAILHEQIEKDLDDHEQRLRQRGRPCHHCGYHQFLCIANCHHQGHFPMSLCFRVAHVHAWNPAIPYAADPVSQTQDRQPLPIVHQPGQWFR